MYTKFIMCQGTAQMLNITEYANDNPVLAKFSMLCQNTWVKYYVMQALVIQCDQMIISTVNGKIGVSNGADVDMWTAISEWRELRDNVEHQLYAQRQLGSEYLNKYQFIDVWSRHMALYLIHELDLSDECTKTMSIPDWNRSLRGEYLPIVED
jgi:hypothetical protein